MGAWGRCRLGVLFSVAIVLFLPPLFFSVSELHGGKVTTEKSVVFSGSEGAKMKFDHIVFGPAAGQGLPNRLQCRGSKALNQTYHSSPRDSLKWSGPLLYCIHSLTSYRNIQVFMPHSSVVVLTDPASKFEIRRRRTSIMPINGDYSRGNLMLQRIISYITFLERKLLEKSDSIHHFIFTDSDIAVVDDLGHMFEDFPHFHLAFTFRNNKDQPLNSGLIAIRGTHDGIFRAKLFLERVLEVYKSKFMKASRMLGDQLALAWVVKSELSLEARDFANRKPFMADAEGTSILFLPCAIYNWTPPEGAGQFHGMPLDVKVIHFKGSRKRLMLESWNFFNSSGSSLPDTLCMILLSGRTKYDF